MLCTADTKKDSQPTPIVLSMTKNGPVRDTSARAAQVTLAAAVLGTVSTPKTYG